MSHGISGAVNMAGIDVYHQTSDQKHQLGAMGIAENGDCFRYAKVLSTASDYIAGNLQVSLAMETGHQNVVLGAANSIGDESVEVSVGATQVDANEYDEGMLGFNDVSPEGETYKITTHDASAAGSEDITVNLANPLLTVTTTSSQVELIRNPWNNAAIGQLITERPAGVSITDWDASVANFGWLKTKGFASCLMDSTGSTTGYIACISNATNGAVGVISTIAQEQAVGQFKGTPVNGEFNIVYFTID